MGTLTSFRTNVLDDWILTSSFFGLQVYVFRTCYLVRRLADGVVYLSC